MLALKTDKGNGEQNQPNKIHPDRGLNLMVLLLSQYGILEFQDPGVVVLS